MIRFLDKAEQMGVPDSSTGVKHAKRRIAEINSALSAAQTLDTSNLENAGSVDSLYVMADRVDDSSTQLSKSISKYVSLMDCWAYGPLLAVAECSSCKIHP